MDSCVSAISVRVPLENNMDPRIRARVETRLEEIAMELQSEEMTMMMAEMLDEERDGLQRMLAENDDSWNHLEFHDPEDNPSWPAPVPEARLNRDGDIVVMLPCTECGLVDETTAGMDGMCADCFWESNKRARRSCQACGCRGPLTLALRPMGAALLCELCRDIEAEEDTRGCGNCAGCAYCLANPDFVPADEV